MNIARIAIGKSIEIFRTDSGWAGNDARLVNGARAIATAMPPAYYPDIPAAEAAYVAKRMGGKFTLLRDPPPAEPGVIY